MIVLLLLLSIPFLGGVALAIDHYARSQATRDERETLLIVQKVLAILLAGTSVTTIAILILQDRPNPADPKDLGVWLAKSAAILYALLGLGAGIMAQISARELKRDSVAALARADRSASIYRLLCWAVLLLPLSGFVPPLLIVAPLLVTTAVACWGAMMRGNEASLLWRLAIAMENGLPLDQEVTAAALGASASRRDDLLGLADRLRDGRSLADSLEVGTRLLPRSTILAIRAAEGTDALPQILRSAAHRSVRELADLGGPRDALPFQAYIVNMFGLIALIASFMMYWIVPKLKAIFNDYDYELPVFSREMFRLADGAASYWYLLGPVLVIPMALILLPSMISMIGWQNLNVPLLMRWFPRRDGPSILRALAAAAGSSKPMPDVLNSLAEHHPRDDMRNRLHRLAEMTQSGDGSWNILAREGLVNRDEAQALDAAARAGQLAWAMNSLADVSEYRQRVREAWWLEWQRPAMMLLLAAVTAAFCLAVFLPLVGLLNGTSLLEHS